jgi:hypothetical protein
MKTFPLHDIKATEYIGNSLTTINSNFVSLSTNVQDMSVRYTNLRQDFINLEQNITLLNNFFNTNYTSNVCQIRVSSSLLYADASLSKKRRLINVQSIFLHPVEGGSVSLYNTISNTWETQVLPGVIEVSIATLSPHTLYDIFIKYNSVNNVFETTFTTTSSNKKATLDGIYVHLDDNNKRYIGCFYKELSGVEQTYNYTQVGDSKLKQHLWNNSNQVKAYIKGYNSLQNYTLPIFLPKNSKNLNVFSNTDGRKTFWNKSNTFSFICGKSTSIQVVYTTFVELNNKNAYIGISLNDEYQPFKESLALVNENNDGVMVMSCSIKIDVEPGLHKVYTFDASEESVRFNVKSKSYYEVIFLN